MKVRASSGHSTSSNVHMCPTWSAQSFQEVTHLGFGFCDVNVVLFVVVVEADAVPPSEAGEAAQGHLQHRLGVADVQEILAYTDKSLSSLLIKGPMVQSL